VKAGKVDALVTAGNTGAALAVSMFQLKRIPGVKRPAITAVGEIAGHLVTIVDIGANTDTKLEWLKQFALMGNLYAERVLGVTSPRVGLLSNGTENAKGNDLVREAYPALRAMSLNFVGNVEPGDLFTGNVDVIVTDGYVGNVMLKTFEASLSNAIHTLRSELTRDWRAKLGALLLKPYLKQAFTQLDPTRYGGAPLLGINGIVIITHGSASPATFRNAVDQARRAVDANLLEVLRDGLSEESEA
jgi:phosphate acyltransferase